MQDAVAYKILTSDQMRALEQDRFEGAPIDVADGYIHLSTAEQVRGTLDAHFAGQQDLFLAAVDLVAAGDAVRWEASRGGQLFPHLYVRLEARLILGCSPLDAGAEAAALARLGCKPGRLS